MPLVSSRFVAALSSIVVACAVTLLPASLRAQATTQTGVSVLSNPPADLPPPPLLRSSGTCHRSGSTWQCPSPCAPHLVFAYNASSGCLGLAVGALDAGRRSEGLPPLALPANFAELSASEQAFVLVNLERIARGVPPLVGLSPALDAVAAGAARAGIDVPPGAAERAVPARAMGATWAGGSPNAAAALFGWLYDDGWAGQATTNVDCTAPGAAACWGHRRVLLGAATGASCRTCIAGSAYAATVGGRTEPSYAFVIEDPTSSRVALTFTWNRNVFPHLRSRREDVRAA